MTEPARLAAVLGSVTPPGRLHRAVSEALARLPAADAVADELIDLGRQRVAFADGRPPEEYGDDTAAVIATVAAAEAVVLASPVYRGTYTGALKNLLDQLPIEALQGKPVGIVAMGATPHHQLGVDWQLREVLAWFGALVAPTSVYLTSRDFRDDGVAEEAATALDELLASTGRMAALTRPGGPLAGLGPAPLAAQRR